MCIRDRAHLNKVGGQSAIGSGVWTAGDIMYAEQDGKPGITKGAQTVEDHGDLKVIGNNTPRYHFGLDLNANYKGFDVRLFFQGVMKRDYLSLIHICPDDRHETISIYFLFFESGRG